MFDLFDETISTTWLDEAIENQSDTTKRPAEA